MYTSHLDRVEQLVREQEEWRRLCINLIASEQVMSKRARNVMGPTSVTATPKAIRRALLPGHRQD